MFMYICTHTCVHTEKYFAWSGSSLKDCVAYSLRLLAETGSSLWQVGISCNFRPGAGFKSSLIFFVQPKSQVCLSCGLLWWLGILFPTALPQVLYWSCVPLSQIYSLSELHAPFNTDHLELLLLNDSAVLWGTKFTANRLLKQWVGLCLQCGSQVGDDKASALSQNNLP